MPKEIIYPRHQGTDDNPAPFIEVGWCRHSTDQNHHVQLASLAGGDYPNRNDRPGFYVDLDRDGINRLIRALRKARDQAYGSDA